MALFKLIGTALKTSVFATKVAFNTAGLVYRGAKSTIKTTVDVIDDVRHENYERACDRVANKVERSVEGLCNTVDTSIQVLDELCESATSDKKFLTNQNVQRLSQIATAGLIASGACQLLDDTNSLDGLDASDSSVLLSNNIDPSIVENGMFIGDEYDLQSLINAGEDPNSTHIDSENIERSIEARNEFLAMHDYTEVPEGYEVHHIVPLSEGGADSPENMILVSEEDHETITAAHRQYYRWNA